MEVRGSRSYTLLDRGIPHEQTSESSCGRRIFQLGACGFWCPTRYSAWTRIYFLSFINDLPKAARDSKVRLFADDCVLYRKVSSEAECNLLQDDLNNLEDWENTWKMSFNASKCNTISITRKKNKINHDYSLYNQILEHLPSTTYLGVELKSDLTWKNHIDKTCAKANRQLGFLRRNLQIQNSKIKETAYKGLVRPITDYCATVWDPHFQKYINQLEMVQRRAARFVFNAYQPIAPVTKMINNSRMGEARNKTAQGKAHYDVQDQA